MLFSLTICHRPSTQRLYHMQFSFLEASSRLRFKIFISKSQASGVSTQRCYNLSEETPRSLLLRDKPSRFQYPPRRKIRLFALEHDVQNASSTFKTPCLIIIHVQTFPQQNSLSPSTLWARINPGMNPNAFDLYLQRGWNSPLDVCHKDTSAYIFFKRPYRTTIVCGTFGLTVPKFGADRRDSEEYWRPYAVSIRQLENSSTLILPILRATIWMIPIWSTPTAHLSLFTCSVTSGYDWSTSSSLVAFLASQPSLEVELKLVWLPWLTTYTSTTPVFHCSINSNYMWIATMRGKVWKWAGRETISRVESRWCLWLHCLRAILKLLAIEHLDVGHHVLTHVGVGTERGFPS